MSWVDNLNVISAQWADAIWRASWQGAVLIAIVWVVGKQWRGIPHPLRCALWVIACLRLLIGLTSLSVAIAWLPSDAPVAIPAAMPEAVEFPASFVMPKPPPAAISITAWLMIAWVVGVAVLSVVAVGRVIGTYRMAKRASVCHDPEIVREMQQLRLALGLKRNPRLLFDRESASVLTVGCFRPVILLSVSAMQDCSEAERQMVIAHELCHIARKDVWLGLIPQLAQTLFFFHPLVWITSREFDFAREAACDELAMSCLGVGLQTYGRLLLKLGTGDRSASTLTTPGVSSHFQLLRRRIAMLEQATHRNRLLNGRRTITVIFLAGILGVVPMSLVKAQQTYDRAEVVSKSSLPPAGALPPRSSGAAHAKKASVGAKHLAGAKHAATVKQIASVPRKTVVVSLPAKAKPVLKSIVGIQQPRTVTVFSIQYATADTVLQILSNLYSSDGAAGVTVVEDARTNAVIVSAPQPKLDEIRMVIAKLDIPDQAAGNQQPRVVTKVYHLKYAGAGSIVSTLKGLYPTSALVADPPTNTVLIRATDANHAEIGRLISELDIPKR